MVGEVMSFPPPQNPNTNFKSVQIRFRQKSFKVHCVWIDLQILKRSWSDGNKERKKKLRRCHLLRFNRVSARAESLFPGVTTPAARALLSFRGWSRRKERYRRIYASHRVDGELVKGERDWSRCCKKLRIIARALSAFGANWKRQMIWGFKCASTKKHELPKDTQKGAKLCVARDFVCLTFIASKEKLVNGRLICTAMGAFRGIWSIEAKSLFYFFRVKHLFIL